MPYLMWFFIFGFDSLTIAAEPVLKDASYQVRSEITHSFNELAARTDYALNCQGCHLADATGIAGQVPSLKGQVSRFLYVEGGRQYLIRVPGMSNAALSDEALAGLANWTLLTFDPEHIPDSFHPYTAEEVGRLRRESFTSGASAERNRLLRYLKDGEGAVQKN